MNLRQRSLLGVMWVATIGGAAGCADGGAWEREERTVAATTRSGTRVGLFAGSGAGPEYVTAVREAVAGDPRLSLSSFVDGAVDFRRFDVVVFPGGAGLTEWAALGATGQRNLRAFVSGGGGFVGICAGFYLALSSTAGFVPAEHYEPWARGEGTVDVKIAEGSPVFSTTGTHRLRFVNGPVVHPAAGGGSGYTVLATFQGNIGGAGIVSMVGKPAVIASSYGSGRVVAFSPHPELSGLGSVLRDAVAWAANSPGGGGPP